MTRDTRRGAPRRPAGDQPASSASAPIPRPVSPTGSPRAPRPRPRPSTAPDRGRARRRASCPVHGAPGRPRPRRRRAAPRWPSHCATGRSPCLVDCRHRPRAGGPGARRGGRRVGRRPARVLPQPAPGRARADDRSARRDRSCSRSPALARGQSSATCSTARCSRACPCGAPIAQSGRCRGARQPAPRTAGPRRATSSARAHRRGRLAGAGGVNAGRAVPCTARAGRLCRPTATALKQRVHAAPASTRSTTGRTGTPTRCAHSR